MILLPVEYKHAYNHDFMFVFPSALGEHRLRNLGDHYTIGIAMGLVTNFRVGLGKGRRNLKSA